MSKKPKYLKEELTCEDKYILVRAAIKLVTKLYSELVKYSDPKVFFKYLKKFRSDKSCAVGFTLKYMGTLPVGQTFRPKMINQRLLSDMRNFNERDRIDILESERPAQQFLHPRDLRECVLKKLQVDGIIHHMEEEGVIRGQRRKRMHRGKASNQSVVNVGGRLSEYRVSERIDEMKKTMEKHGAIEYFAEALHYFYGTEFINALIENFMLVSLHALRTLDDVVSMRVAGMTYYYGTITETFSEDFRSMLQDLKALSEDQLKQEAHDRAQSALECWDFYYFLLLHTTVRIPIY
jgi:hypothetical protein